MTLLRLIKRNLWFYRKPYLAIVAGVAVSTAVITGALVVGDSVKFSLQQISEKRLGKIRYALPPADRLFRQDLAGDISLRIKQPVAPLLLTGGIAINSDQNLRINEVQVVGIDERFKEFCNEIFPEPGPDEAIISRNVAKRLNLHTGDAFLLRVRKIGKASVNAPFMGEKEPSESFRVTVSAIAGDDQLGRFSLKNNQTAPYNIFLSLKQLAYVLDLQSYANVLLVPSVDSRISTVVALDSVLSLCRKPVDAGIQIRKLSAGGKYQVISDRIFFEDSTARSVASAIPGCEPILTYLVNSISCGGRSTPYSFVTAANESFVNQPLGSDEIILSDWLASDLAARPGDSVMLRYFLMGPLNSLREDSMWFTVRSVIPIKNAPFDRALMPDFPGMSEAGNCRDWETGAPIDLKKIRDKDEVYWKDFRGTPKAFISLGSGQKIWNNSYGKFTAFRFNAMESEIHGIEEALTNEIRKGSNSLSFRPVYAEAETAVRNSTNFGELFASLSFFILLSALLLSAMLFSLHARMRTSETGILAALGFTRRVILQILATEAVVVVVVGSVIGIFVGILYNYLIVMGLNTIWQDAVNTSQLVIKINCTTLFAGAISGIVTSLTVLLFMLWKNLRQPLSTLVKGGLGMRHSRYGRTLRLFMIGIAVTSFGTSLVLLLWALIPGNSPNSSLTMVAGGLMMAGGLALLNHFLGVFRQTPLHKIPGFMQIVLRNLALRRSRTVSAVALLSLGVFTIIITGSNRKTLYGTETARNSGTGGFLLWAESSLPVMYDINSQHGAKIFALHDEELLRPARFIQLARKDGDDASCLNLNQVSMPAILGVPVTLFDRMQVFSFAGLDQSADKDHPWSALSVSLAPDVIPCYADQTVITWGLRKSIGDTLFYKDESGRILKIKLLGGLENSIFQGNIILSDSLLRKFYPSSGGTRIMLIDGPAHQRDTIAGRIEDLFRDYGMMATPASERLASFNAVENAYLSVFMILGGLGVIIGTIGLGIVLLRNISQRKQELALYVAMGFKRRFIFSLILTEHTLILLSGLILGLVSALAGISSLQISEAISVPWFFISGILLMILANGLAWIFIPAHFAMNTDLIPALREE